MDSKYFQKAVDFRNELLSVIIKKVIEKGGKVKLEQELNILFDQTRWSDVVAENIAINTIQLEGGYITLYFDTEGQDFNEVDKYFLNDVMLVVELGIIADSI